MFLQFAVSPVNQPAKRFSASGPSLKSSTNSSKISDKPKLLSSKPPNFFEVGLDGSMNEKPQAISLPLSTTENGHQIITLPKSTLDSTDFNSLAFLSEINGVSYVVTLNDNQIILTPRKDQAKLLKVNEERQVGRSAQTIVELTYDD